MSAPRGRAARHPRDLAYGDTNLFVALLVGPDHPLHEPALGVFRRVADGELGLIVTAIVVAELTYVVRSLLGWTPHAIAEQIVPLLEAEGIVLQERATLVRALELYASHARLDFADAYLAAAALEAGPAAVASFDRDLDAIEGIRRIAS